MQKVFIQKRGGSTRKFTLTDGKISVESKTIRSNVKYDVRLENLGSDIQYIEDNTKQNRLAIAVAVCVPFLVWAVYLAGDRKGDKAPLVGVSVLSFTMVLINFFKQYRDDIILAGGRDNLVFFRKVPNEAAVLDFIEAIKAASLRHVASRYINAQALHAQGTTSIHPDLDKILDNREAILNNLRSLAECLEHNDYQGQASFVIKLYDLLDNYQLEPFISKISGAGMWGGAGAVWEVYMADKESHVQFAKLMIYLIDLLAECYITNVRIASNRDIFCAVVAGTI